MSSVAGKMSVVCPQCGKGLTLPASAAGKSGRCPSCTHVFRLPELVAATAVSEPALAPLSPFEDEAGPDYQLQALPPAPFGPPQAGYSPAGYPQQPGYAPPGNAFQPTAANAFDPHMPAINTHAPATSANANPSKYNHGFGLEQRGWDAGMVGGLVMMLIGGVWFFGGLAVGYIFFYAPILFVIGLVGFVRGLFTGNVAGR